MPGQQRLRRNDRTQLFKHLPSDSLGLGGQAAAVVVGETQPLPTQLLPQNTILLPKVIDEQRRLIIHPSGQGGPDESERVQEAGHSGSNIITITGPGAHLFDLPPNQSDRISGQYAVSPVGLQVPL